MWIGQSKEVEISKVEAAQGGESVTVHLRTILDDDDKNALGVLEEHFARSGAKVKYKNSLGRYSCLLLAGERCLVALDRDLSKPEIEVTVDHAIHYAADTGAAEDKIIPIYESWLQFRICIPFAGDCSGYLWALVTNETATLRVFDRDTPEEELLNIKRLFEQALDYETAVTELRSVSGSSGAEVN